MALRVDMWGAIRDIGRRFFVDPTETAAVVYWSIVALGSLAVPARPRFGPNEGILHTIGTGFSGGSTRHSDDGRSCRTSSCAATMRSAAPDIFKRVIDAIVDLSRHNRQINTDAPPSSVPMGCPKLEAFRLVDERMPNLGMRSSPGNRYRCWLFLGVARKPWGSPVRLLTENPTI
jgi:hypothetical protein